MTFSKSPVVWGTGKVSSLEVAHTLTQFQVILERWREGRVRFDPSPHQMISNTQALPESAYDEFLVIDTNAGTLHMERNGTPLPGYHCSLPPGLSSRFYRVTPDGTEPLEGVIRFRLRGIYKDYQEMFWLIGEGRGIGMALGFSNDQTMDGILMNANAPLSAPKLGRMMSGVTRTRTLRSFPIAPPKRDRLENGERILDKTPEPPDPFDSAIFSDDEYTAHRKLADAHIPAPLKAAERSAAQLDANRAAWLAALKPILMAVEQDLRKTDLDGKQQITSINHNPAFTNLDIVGHAQEKSLPIPYIYYLIRSKFADISLKIDRIDSNVWYAHSKPMTTAVLQSNPLLNQEFIVDTNATSPSIDTQEWIEKGRASVAVLHQPHLQIQINEDSRIIIQGISRGQGAADPWWRPDGQPASKPSIYITETRFTLDGEGQTFCFVAIIDAPDNITAHQLQIEPTAYPIKPYTESIGIQTYHENPDFDFPKSTNRFIRTFEYESPPKKATLRFAISNRETGKTRWVRLENVSLRPGQDFGFKMFVEPESP